MGEGGICEAVRLKLYTLPLKRFYLFKGFKFLANP